MTLAEIVSGASDFRERYASVNSQIRKAFRDTDHVFVDSSRYSPRRLARESAFAFLSLYEVTLQGSASYKK